MSTWVPVLAACVAAYLLKLAGHLVPARWLEGPRVRRVTGLLPVALLAALVVVQTVVADQRLVLDARAAGLAVAAVALLLRAPFVVVVVLAALTAALLRHAGWAA
ncbi:AzlD domain-containing protein [Lapillicoccus jejuensis]|uniref:Branched-subunit amino acid transport protein AzlD n=1 Tax=Lapillicoccus jejuensis TaxID=402171 RepID=A0A542E3Y1_9MICO|nr:AzlD domain-containing protein [Lapillicoccus jejuensis]TQJ10027.1 branched-subunit amino acid transport protein AzlD [Lapillicoccus jejuensis]